MNTPEVNKPVGPAAPPKVAVPPVMPGIKPGDDGKKAADAIPAKPEDKDVKSV